MQSEDPLTGERQQVCKVSDVDILWKVYIILVILVFYFHLSQ